MQTSAKIHSIGARNLYRNLEPTRRQTRRLCLTLLSTNLDHDQRYADHVRSFAYIAADRFDIWTHYPVVVEALSVMSKCEMLPQN